MAPSIGSRKDAPDMFYNCIEEVKRQKNKHQKLKQQIDRTGPGQDRGRDNYQ